MTPSVEVRPPVRPATLDDATAIAALEREATGRPWSLGMVRSALESSTCRAFVVGAPHAVGYAVTRVVADEAELLILGVAPHARRRGLASALLDACEEAWRSAGITQAWLDVSEHNHGARALYGRRGWVQVSARRGYYGSGEDALVLRWAP